MGILPSEVCLSMRFQAILHAGGLQKLILAVEWQALGADPTEDWLRDHTDTVRSHNSSKATTC